MNQGSGWFTVTTTHNKPSLSDCVARHVSSTHAHHAAVCIAQVWPAQCHAQNFYFLYWVTDLCCSVFLLSIVLTIFCVVINFFRFFFKVETCVYLCFYCYAVLFLSILLKCDYLWSVLEFKNGRTSLIILNIN